EVDPPLRPQAGERAVLRERPDDLTRNRDDAGGTAAQLDVEPRGVVGEEALLPDALPPHRHREDLLGVRLGEPRPDLLDEPFDRIDPFLPTPLGLGRAELLGL